MTAWDESFMVHTGTQVPMRRIPKRRR
jgi:hypothetical protein